MAKIVLIKSKKALIKSKKAFFCIFQIVSLSTLVACRATEVSESGSLETPAPEVCPDSIENLSIRANYRHVCLVTNTGGVKCWGKNSSGQIGDDTIVDKGIPTAVTSLESPVLTVETGAHHTCALHTDKTVSCWGSSFGLTPVKIAGVQDVKEHSSGAFRKMALLENGSVVTWEDSATVSTVATIGSTDALKGVSVAAGYNHYCVAVADGTVWCWGGNAKMQLGDGTTTSRSDPVQVIGVSDAVQVAVGNNHSCALNSSGYVWCWGWDGGSTGAPAYEVQPLSGVEILYGSPYFNQALLANSGVRRWFGALEGVSVTEVTGATEPVAVAPAENSTCLVEFSGVVKCFGRNTEGQLGNNQIGTDSTDPVVVELDPLELLPVCNQP